MVVVFIWVPIIILVCKGIKISVVHVCHRVVLCNQSLYYNEVLYSLTKECPWVEHLTGRVGALLGVFTFDHERVPLGGAPYRSAKERGGAFLGVFAFNHERVPMSVVLQ